MAEKRITGIYNTVGPSAPTTYEQLVNAARDAVPKPEKITWVPVNWLTSRKDRDMWGMLLFWHFQAIGGLLAINIDRALAAGLTTRPLSATLADVLRWYKESPPEQQAGLVTGHKRQPDGSFARTTATWADYLEYEREALAAWHAEQPK